MATEPPVPTVYLVDDDEAFLRALSRLMRLAGFRAAAYPSAAELLEELPPGAAGCVVADLSMPGMDGMALQAALCEAGSDLPIVFLTGHGDIPTSVQAMRCGAEDFLTKQAPKEEIFAAVRRALARNARARSGRARAAELRRAFALLSPREREVLEHVVRGKLNKQIAADLGIHERTVKLHRTAISAKLKVQSVAELVRLWMEINAA